MPTTFDILMAPRTKNVNIQYIKIRYTPTEQCTSHLTINFVHLGGGSTSANVTLRRNDPVEWTQIQSAALFEHIFIFPITYKCPGIQELATCVYIPESEFSGSEGEGCCCSDWV